MKTQINVNNVFVHIAERGVINQPDLADVEFVYDGKIVDIDTKHIEDFKFTGLSNIDFVKDYDWDANTMEPIFDDGPFNGIVPNTLDEAIETILAQLTPANIQDIMHIEEGDVEVAHGRSENLDMYMCLNGLRIRNDWRLWDATSHSLSSWFADHEIYHADDMSGIVCKAVWMNLKGLGEINIEQEAEWFKQWWDLHGLGGYNGVEADYYETRHACDE